MYTHLYLILIYFISVLNVAIILNTFFSPKFMHKQFIWKVCSMLRKISLTISKTQNCVIFFFSFHDIDRTCSC